MKIKLILFTIMLTHTAFAAPAVVCKHPALQIKLDLKTDTGTTAYSQDLDVSFQKEGGQISSASRATSRELKKDDCQLWQTILRKDVTLLMSDMQVKLNPKEAKLSCDKVGKVSWSDGKKRQKVSVCINHVHSTRQSLAFLQLYESLESLLSIK